MVSYKKTFKKLFAFVLCFFWPIRKVDLNIKKNIHKKINFGQKVQRAEIEKTFDLLSQYGYSGFL